MAGPVIVLHFMISAMHCLFFFSFFFLLLLLNCGARQDMCNHPFHYSLTVWPDLVVLSFVKHIIAVSSIICQTSHMKTRKWLALVALFQNLTSTTSFYLAKREGFLLAGSSNLRSDRRDCSIRLKSDKCCLISVDK